MIRDGKDNVYRSRLGFLPNKIIEEVTSRGMTRLCFPVATSQTDARPKHLLIYTIGEFVDLKARIETGRDTYVGLLGNLQQRADIRTWARRSHLHHGTRWDYDHHGYITEEEPSVRQYVLKVLDFNRRYSPPLVHLYGDRPAWPLDSTGERVRSYREVHQKPVPLPKSVNQRADNGELDLDELLAVPRNPKPVVARPVRGFHEIAL